MPSMMSVMEYTLRRVAGLDRGVGLSASTRIAQPIVDAGLLSSASVMTAVIFDFDHLLAPLFAIIRAKLAEDIGVLCWCVAGVDCAMRAL
jgi:hypothetical protein